MPQETNSNRAGGVRSRLAVELVISMIEADKLQAGDLLPTEIEMQRRLDVSRNILREALSYLKGLGMIESRRGSGFRVAQVNPVAVFGDVLKLYLRIAAADLGEVFSLRRVLELGAIDLAVRQASVAERERIQRLAAELSRESLQGRRTQRLVELDVEFHCALTESAGCALLSVLNQAIREFFRVSSAREETDGIEISLSVIEDTDRDHQILAHAFANNLPEVATLCLRRHIDMHERIGPLSGREHCPENRTTKTASAKYMSKGTNLTSS